MPAVAGVPRESTTDDTCTSPLMRGKRSPERKTLDGRFPVAYDSEFRFASATHTVRNAAVASMRNCATSILPSD